MSDAAVELQRVSATLLVLLRRQGKPFVLRDPVSGALLPLEYDEVASPRGFLPAFLVAAEGIWSEATGNGFSLRVVERPRTLLGYTVEVIGGGTFSAVMLSMMELLALLDDGGPSLVGNNLSQHWSVLALAQSLAGHVAPAPTAGPGPA